MPVGVPDTVRAYLAAHYTMTLATSLDGRPWAAAVFYACDGDLRLYFVSDPKTRHATEGTANPAVAVAIHAHDQSWQSIRGVQIEGRLAVVAPEDRSRVEGLYVARFPVIGRMVRAATSDAERLVGQRLLAATFYAVTPLRLRFIDNTRGFGHRDEFVLDTPGTQAHD
jgi:uncharacterized protein YhbP (UPF0306 family)